MSRPAKVAPASVAVARAFFEAISRRDGSAVGELFVDDAELDVPGAHLRGAVVIRDLFTDLLAHRLPGLSVGRPRVLDPSRVVVPIVLCGPRRRLPLAASFWIEGGDRIGRLLGREHPMPGGPVPAPRRQRASRTA